MIYDIEYRYWICLLVLLFIIDMVFGKCLITNFQCGFRSKRSTVDHLVRLETFVREAFIKKEHLTAVFFDLEKAYDTTWKYGIMRDLSDFGLKGRLESNGLITNFQCGFRSKRSTVDHLVRLETFVREAFIKKEHLTAVFFDLEKAYDTTWKYGIMRDLSDFGLKGRLPHFIDNFLSNRNFKVRVGTTLSDLQGQEGVPKGCILSVTLFSIKINNIVKSLNPGVDCSLYVDDFLICYR